MVSSFQDAVGAGSGMLTDGGIETRIMFETDVPLPEHVQVAALVTGPTGGPVLRGIYESYVAAASPFARRLVKFKANTSALGTEELVRLDRLEGDDPERLAAGMWEIHEQFGLRILGGCCGTDDRHIRALAARMAGAEGYDR